MLLTHGDSIDKVGDGFRVVAKSGNLTTAIANEKLRIYGVQFHPEVKVYMLHVVFSFSSIEVVFCNQL